MTPFQKALTRALLERYQIQLTEEAVPREEPDPDQCLWIDWKTKTISLTKKQNYCQILCSSTAQRDAAIDRLRRKRFTIIP